MKKLVILFIVLPFLALAQQVRVDTSIDTLKNKIGAEFKLTIKATVDTSSLVAFPKIKNIGQLEIIRSYPVDSIIKGAKMELIKKYGLTQFDSGHYKIPQIVLLVDRKPYLTDSLEIYVNNVVVDTLSQKMFDIKDVMPAESKMGNWWIYLLVIIILGVGGYFGYKYYIENIKNKNGEPAEIKYKTPIEKATILLNDLEKRELWQKGEVKNYYSELTDIARAFIEELVEIPAMESTSTELIMNLKVISKKKKMKLSQEIIEDLEKVLMQADLVKFAKSRPMDFEIEEDSKKIQKAILVIDKSVPIVVADEEENLLNEAQRQQQLKEHLLREKKRKTRIIIYSSVAAFVLIIGTIIVLKGFDYLKDNIIGHPTKELLEEEWIKSEYGNPSIVVETPRVLKRVNLASSMPKEGMALIKEMQSFAYGSILDNFYLMVSTVKFNQESQLDLSKALEGSIQFIEKGGAQNMIVKEENFETKEGRIKGIKGSGTFSKLNSTFKTSTKFYYEILLFNQENGLQQIMIMYEEGDKYAIQISNRMLDSVELKKM